MGDEMRYKDDSRIELFARLLGEIFVVLFAQYAYNHYIALPNGMVTFTYFQVLLIRIILAWFSQKLL